MSNWSLLTVAQLKVHLRKHGLKLSGRKADLVKRLQEHSDANKTSASSTAINKETKLVKEYGNILQPGSILVLRQV